MSEVGMGLALQVFSFLLLITWHNRENKTCETDEA